MLIVAGVLYTSPVGVSSLVSDDGSKIKGVGEHICFCPRIADVAAVDVSS